MFRTTLLMIRSFFCWLERIATREHITLCQRGLKPKSMSLPTTPHRFYRVNVRVKSYCLIRYRILWLNFSLLQPHSRNLQIFHHISIIFHCFSPPTHESRFNLIAPVAAIKRPRWHRHFITINSFSFWRARFFHPEAESENKKMTREKGTKSKPFLSSLDTLFLSWNIHVKSHLRCFYVYTIVRCEKRTLIKKKNVSDVCTWRFKKKSSAEEIKNFCLKNIQMNGWNE
jgi:hypothetical protein